MYVDNRSTQSIAHVLGNFCDQLKNVLLNCIITSFWPPPDEYTLSIISLTISATYAHKHTLVIQEQLVIHSPVV